MATSAALLSFRPTGIRSSGDRKPENNRRKVSSVNWWTPLFGWGSDPDYIDGKNTTTNGDIIDLSGCANMRDGSVSFPERTAAGSRSRFAPGSFTEEKAKQLRLMTVETENFHDIMYHSAIASRLASDFPNRSSQ
ncbi:uncharacterized protein LOC122092790 [Macadamia integrifolia]|uniref:uncharacterized protein LOC122092790 n=1 Tax=Macadamia integrifolia TaxID=60698 RepID=UPI001C52B4C0|nr:uncharacterized protein LOC122092790 [Macadamia integrifolia]